MKMHTIRSLSVLLPLLLASCGEEEKSHASEAESAGGMGGATGGESGGDSGGAEEQRPDVIIPSTTKVLDEASIDALTEFDDTSVTATSPNEQLEEIVEGDVIVAPATTKTPYGLLRKVTAVEKDGETIRFTTRSAALTDAIEKGKASLSATLQTADVISSNTFSYPGSLGTKRVARAAAPPPLATVQAALTGPDGYFIGFNNVVLHDADEDATTTDDQVLLNGGISATAGLTIDVDLDWFKVNTMALGAEFSESVNLAVSATEAASLDEEMTVHEFSFTPITFYVGPVPVVIVPRLVFAVGATGAVATNYESSVYESAEASFLVGYIDGEFDASGDADASSNFEAPTVCGNATLKVYAGPRLEFSLYGVVDAQMGAQAFIQLDADTSADPWWNLHGGVEGYGGVGIGFLGQEIEEWHDTVGLFDETICESPGGFYESVCQSVLSTSNIWAYAFDDGSINSPRKLISTADGGYLVVTGSGNVDTLLIKMDRHGRTVWQKRFGTLYIGTATQLLNQDYLLAGHAPGAEAWIGRIDSEGNLLWSYSVEADTVGADINSIKPTFDGGYVAVGEVSRDEPTYAIWLTRFDSQLNPIWSKSFGRPESDMDEGFQVEMTSDLGFAVLGRLGFASNQTATLFKVDADGEYQWGKAYDGTSTDALYSMISTPSGYAMAGESQTTLFEGGSDEYSGFMAWVLQTNLEGDVLWSRAYGVVPESSSSVNRLSAVDLAQRGDAYRVIGTIDEGSDESNLLVMSVSSADGSPYGITSLGGVEAEEGVSIVNTYDGGFVYLAASKSFDSEQHGDAWLVKAFSGIPFDAGSGAESASVDGVFGDTDQISSGSVDLTEATHALTVSEYDVTVEDADSFFTTQLEGP